MIFSLLKNPLTKIVLNKATEHFKHKAEKVKTIRAAEIEAAKDTEISRIKSQDKSWKDEILMIWLISKEVMCPDGHRCSNYRSRVSVRI